MRRVLLLFMLCLLCGSVIGCQNETGEKTKIALDEKFLITKETSGEYRYQVFDTYGKIICEGVDWREPSIIMVNKDLLCFTMQTGTGLSTQWGFFYDYATGVKSEEFKWILDYNDSMVILGFPKKVVVRNIFDDAYRTELTAFQYPIADVADSILEARFSKNNDVVTVKYVAEGKVDIVSQEFILHLPQV